MVIGQVAGGFITLMLAKFMLNDVPHIVFGNHGNPSGLETDTIITRTGMKEYEYRYFPPPDEERAPRAYPYKKTRHIGHYELVMTRTDSACMIKMYEFLEGWKKKLRATWSSLDKPECDAKFEEIADTIRQVIFETKTQMMR